MKRIALYVAVAVFLPGAAARAADSADDKKNIQGKWALTKIDKGDKLQDVAKTSDEFFQMQMSGDKITVEFPAGKEEGTYKIDAGKKVKTIDITARTSDDKGKTLLGIYSLDGDTLKLCIAEAEVKERPGEFKSKKDKITVYVLKRAK